MTHLARALRRGDVVAHGRRQAVVWDVRADGVELLPIVGAAELRHRGDVDFTEDDLIGGPLASRHGLVRCAERRRAAGGVQILVARATPALVRRLETAIARDLEARRLEATPPVASHLTRCDGPGRCGRRVSPRGVS